MVLVLDKAILDKKSWFWCTYHGKVAAVDDKSRELRCSDGDGTYSGHCTCVGPWFTKEEAEFSEHAKFYRDRHKD